MPCLDASLRNDYLRISLPDEHPDAEMINSMQSEFVELLESAACSEVVIVALPSVDQLDHRLISMLLTWHRIAALAGRRLRINGISRVVSQVRQQLSETRSPHHSLHRHSGIRHAFA